MWYGGDFDEGSLSFDWRVGPVTYGHERLTHHPRDGVIRVNCRCKVTKSLIVGKEVNLITEIIEILGVEYEFS